VLLRRVDPRVFEPSREHASSLTRVSPTPKGLWMLQQSLAMTCSAQRSLGATHRLLQGGAVDQRQFINFVRQRGLAVLATRGADGAPQAALVGITATGRGELVFDTSRSSRKYRNLSAFAQ
jgi:Pyridoxamine 5'-phosphate oxidase